MCSQKPQKDVATPRRFAVCCSTASTQDGGNQVRPVPETPSHDSAAAVQVRPDPAVDTAGEWTQVGPGGTRISKRRA
eukprot:6225547-Amphidinium_carterae.1